MSPRRHDLWVVVDEVYDSLVFDGVHLGFRALPGMAERTVAIGSLSKSHAMTGWRVGWLVGPKALVDHVERLALNMLYGLPGFIQEAALTALEDYDATTETMRTIYRRRLALVSHRSGRSSGSRVLRPEAGMFCLVDVRSTGLTSYDFAWGLFRRTGVSLLDAAAFGPATQGFVRLAFAASEERLADACDRITGYARGLRRSRGRHANEAQAVGGGVADRRRSRFSSIQSARPATLAAASRPSGVRLYSTCGGTTGKARRSTSPSLSSHCSVCASIRSLTPLTLRRNALKRCTPPCSAMSTSTPQRLVTCRITSRDGQPSRNTSPRCTRSYIEPGSGAGVSVI